MWSFAPSFHNPPYIYTHTHVICILTNVGHDNVSEAQSHKKRHQHTTIKKKKTVYIKPHLIVYEYVPFDQMPFAR
jgi:hypothetical protein